MFVHTSITESIRRVHIKLRLTFKAAWTNQLEGEYTWVIARPARHQVHYFHCILLLFSVCLQDPAIEIRNQRKLLNKKCSCLQYILT